jgi:hypothetical protein
MASRIAPGRHIFLDTFVVRHDFEHLAQRQFFDFLRGHDDRHRAEVPERIELHIGLYHSVPLLCVYGLFGFSGCEPTHRRDQIN